MWYLTIQRRQGDKKVWKTRKIQMYVQVLTTGYYGCECILDWSL